MRKRDLDRSSSRSSPISSGRIRKQTTREFEHSWRLLPPPEQQALQQLAVFRGGCGREAAAAVAGAGLPLLAALVDKSLLQTTPAGRYEQGLTA